MSKDLNKESMAFSSNLLEKTPRLLIVNDVQVILSTLKIRLAKQFFIETAETGFAAVKRT